MKKAIYYLSLAFIPTVATLAISCSSNNDSNTTTKKPTNVISKISASDIGLIDQLASDVQNTINNSFIYNNKEKFLTGDYNLSSASQITLIDKNLSDDESSISLSFQLSKDTWYDDQGSLGNTSKTFTTIIKGFKPRTFLKTEIRTSIDASVFGWSNDEATNKESSITSNFIFMNLSRFFTGETSKINSENITISSKNVVTNSIEINISLAAGSFYSENNLLSTSSKTFTTKITGFKSSTTNTLNFKEQRFFNWGDSNIDTLDNSVTEEYLKNKIIQNRNDFLNIPNNTKYNEQFFNQNLSITNYGKNNLEGFITITVQINDNNSVIQENICINGFKKFDESSIVYPTVKNPTTPTDEEIEAETKFWSNIPLGLSKYYFTQDELDQINDEDLRLMLIDLRTNKIPIPLTDVVTVPTFDYVFENIVIDTTNNLIKTKLYIYDMYDESKYRSIDKEFKYKLFTSTEDTKKDIVNKINNVIKVIPKNDSYKQIKAKLFSRYDSNQMQQYFELNNNEIDNLFWIEPEFQNIIRLFITSEQFYNFKNPTLLDFEIQVSYRGDSNISIIKLQTISDFKDVQTIGTLDKEPIINLTTPQGAVSYKEELEKFYFDEFITTNRTNYEDVLKNMSYEDIKKEIIYHVRFYLYQMFSDNYSEINYYIKNDNPTNHTFDAIGEGIIKSDMDNVMYGFQPHIATDGSHTTSSVKKGDKIRVELSFDVRDLLSGYKPTLFERGVEGTFTYQWYWDYENKCKLNIDKNSPYFKDDVPRNFYAVSYWKVYINNQSTISTKMNNYGAPLFSSQFFIPKNNKNNNKRIVK